MMSGCVRRRCREAKSLWEEIRTSGKIVEAGRGRHRHGERIEPRLTLARAARHPPGWLAAVETVLHRLDLQLGAAPTEFDLVALVERGVLDALAIEPGPVAASGIDQEVASILVPDLRMSARRVQVDLGIEVDVAIRHAPNANQILFELELASIVSALDLAKSNHETSSIGGRDEVDHLRTAGLDQYVFANLRAVGLAHLEMIRAGRQPQEDFFVEP